MPILSGEDEVRQTRLRVPDHVSRCGNKGEECTEICDQLISVDVLYFQTPETVAETMLKHKCNSYHATVNNVFDGEGYLNNAEVFYTTKNDVLIQTNIETGNSYEHKNLDWVWDLQNFKYKGKYLNAEMTQRTVDRVRILFTLTKLPNRVKRNIDLKKYTMCTFNTWKNNYTGSRTYRVDGTKQVAYDEGIVKYLVTKQYNTPLKELNSQLVAEVKNCQLRGYHLGNQRVYVNIPLPMFKVYVMIAKEEILTQRLDLHLADNALDLLSDAVEHADEHKLTLWPRLRKYMRTWHVFSATDRPEDHPGVHPDMWSDKTAELHRQETVQELPAPVLQQTEFDIPKHNAKEDYKADDGVKLLGVQPEGVELYVPTQNMRELEVAVATRANNIPADGQAQQHARRMTIFRQYLLRGKSFDDVFWTLEGFAQWVSKYPPQKQAKYWEVVNCRLEGVQDNLDAMRPEHRELTVRDLFVKMEALYKVHAEGTELEVKPRLIISSHEMVNLYYGPIVDMVKQRLKQCLHESVLPIVYTDGNSPQQNADLYWSRYTPGDDIAENDYSKYDKTQGKWLKETEFEIYEALGLRNCDLANWRQTTKCKYTSRKYGFKSTVRFQRQTGDPTTSLGNSLINLMVSLDAYDRAGVDLMDLQLMMVLGDDNLALFPGGTLTNDRVGKIEATNRECGLAAKYKVLHEVHDSEYCSTNFICTTEGFVALPKIGKALARLNVRSKYHPSVSDDQYRVAKRFSHWLANCNNPLGRVVSDLYSSTELEVASTAKAYNLYETDQLTRRYTERQSLPTVTDSDFTAFLNDRYGTADLGPLLHTMRTMHTDNDLTQIGLDPVMKVAIKRDM